MGGFEFKTLAGREIQKAATSVISDLQTKFISQRHYSVYRTTLQTSALHWQRFKLSVGQNWRDKSRIWEKQGNSNNAGNKMKFISVTLSSISLFSFSFVVIRLLSAHTVAFNEV
jgi:hypothetical protein